VKIGIPERALLACEPLQAGTDAVAVGEAIACGLRAGGAPAPDACALPARTGEPARLLARLDFDRRMLAARALVIAVARLTPRTLAGSLAFELATRARQSGVPCYAIASENRLDAFDERMLDLQIVLCAGSSRELEAAGWELAQVI
jgi:glycerate kinase